MRNLLLFAWRHDCGHALRASASPLLPSLSADLSCFPFLHSLRVENLPHAPLRVLAGCAAVISNTHSPPRFKSSVSLRILSNGIGPSPAVAPWRKRQVRRHRAHASERLRHPQRTLPANPFQAQHDYFGAHTCKHVDKPSGEFFHTNWPRPPSQAAAGGAGTVGRVAGRTRTV
jgi:hypothetical protein